MGTTSTESSTSAVDQQALYRKLMRRILPFLLFCYLVSYLDRVNAGFAAFTMNSEIALSATAFGIGVGLVSAGNLGGFVGPFMIGFVRDISGGFTAPLMAIGCTLLFGATLMIVFGRLVRREATPVAVAP